MLFRSVHAVAMMSIIRFKTRCLSSRRNEEVDCSGNTPRVSVCSRRWLPLQTCSESLGHWVTQHLSDLRHYPRRMKNRIKKFDKENTEVILKTFGEARLIQSGGKVRLHGGSMADRMEALEWLSVFMPEAVACIGR